MSVHVERSAPLMIVTIDRPQARNAIDRATALAINEALDELDGSPEFTVAVITGAGRTFCAGADLKALLRGELPRAERGFAGIATRPPRKPITAAVGPTHQHTNRDVLVEGPEITIRPMGTRRVVAGGSR